MGDRHLFASLAQSGEELVDLRPSLLSAVEASPVHADQTDQLVAGVDLDREELEPAVSLIHQQRLDVGPQISEFWKRGAQVVPGFQGQQGYSGPRRARVERD